MKTFVIPALFLIAASLPAAAQDDVPISTEAIYVCVEIEDNALRLACYDESVARLQAAEASGDVTTISKAEVEELQKDSFGFSLPSIPRIVMPKLGQGDDKDGGLDTVTIAVAQVERLRYDNLRVTLENGQIWEQTDGKRVQYSKRLGVKSAEIKRAALGSFKMTLDGGRSFRAKRIR